MSDDERLEDKEDDHDHAANVIDHDLYEEIDDEEMYELVQTARAEAWERDRLKREERKLQRPFPRWLFWLIAFALVMNVFTFMPQKISIPAIDFLMTSAKLSQDPLIKSYKEAIVTIQTGDSSGTGFSISADGLIITNDHVIDGNQPITIGFSSDGLYTAEIIERFPSIDTAILRVDGNDLPYLTIAVDPQTEIDERVHFIGNPLSFNRIANEGELIGYTSLSDWDEPVGMISAPIYRGNSGSPIINEDEEVIGVVFATTKHSEHGKLGLFVPIGVIDSYYDLKED